MMYTDQDTEQARATEAGHSSAGIQTQQLHAPLPPALAYGRTKLGPLALIVLGVVLLLGRSLPGELELTGGMVLLTISSCFLFFAFWKRLYGLLIPGCILAGLSVGVTFADLTDGVSVVWGLSLGFLSIFALGSGMFGQRSQWPVIPAVILFAVGVIVAASSLPVIFTGGLIWLPLLLVAAGVYLGWMRRSA